MKKFSIALLAALVLAALAGCATAEEAAPMAKVTFFDSDGVTVLKETEVAIGSTLADPGLAKEGYAIQGYFATPALLRPFDMAAPIVEDTSVFVAWRSTIVDDNPWMIAGSLRCYPDNLWGKVWPQDAYRLHKVEGEFNTFSIDVSLYKGDEFKIAVIGEGYAWDDNHSLDASNLADHSEGAVLSGGENAFDTGANIKVLADGKYRLTITTDAETLPLCKIEAERIGEPDAPPAPKYDMKIWASFNDWAGQDMKKNGDDLIWYGECDVPEGGGEFGVKNAADGSWYSSNGNKDNIKLDAGHYMVFIQLELVDGAPKLKGDIVAETPAYYVVGTCGNGGWAADANSANEAYKMVEKDGKYVLETEFKDSETADWAGGKVAFKVVYGAGGRVANEFWYGDNGENILVDPGQRTIVFDPATGLVTVD